METDDRYTRITLRIPKHLHERLATAAEDTSKSMNAEIIARLSESFITKSAEERAVERVTELDCQIAALTVESHSLLREAGAIADLMGGTSSEQEKTLLRDRLDKILSKVGHIEVAKQRLVSKVTDVKL